MLCDFVAFYQLLGELKSFRPELLTEDWSKTFKYSWTNTYSDRDDRRDDLYTLLYAYQNLFNKNLAVKSLQVAF
jgi:hypothetical protein